MKLLRHTPVNPEALEEHFIIHEVLASHDVEELKAKASELCKLENLVPNVWVSKYPIMGDALVEQNIEWVMKLDNGMYFSIEK